MLDSYPFVLSLKNHCSNTTSPSSPLLCNTTAALYAVIVVVSVICGGSLVTTPHLPRVTMDAIVIVPSRGYTKVYGVGAGWSHFDSQRNHTSFWWEENVLIPAR